MNNTTDDTTEYSHQIYKTDPLIYRNLVGKKVKILTESASEHVGFLYTVDPVSESAVLLKMDKTDEISLEIVCGHAIKNVESISTVETFIPDLFLTSLKNLPESIIAERKASVQKLLTDNKFQVTDVDGTLRIENILSIESPYGPEDCICTNSIVLSRIQNLLNNIKR